MIPSMSSLSFDAASTASPLRTVVLFHSGFSRVEETTYLGMLLNLSANSPSRAGQAPAKLSYVTRPRRRASVSSVSWSLNWFPSSPRSKANDHPGYLNSSPPGACITPSSDTNSVTTNLPIWHSLSVAVADQTVSQPVTHRREQHCHASGGQVLHCNIKVGWLLRLRCDRASRTCA